MIVHISASLNSTIYMVGIGHNLFNFSCNCISQVTVCILLIGVYILHTNNMHTCILAVRLLATDLYPTINVIRLPYIKVDWTSYDYL